MKISYFWVFSLIFFVLACDINLGGDDEELAAIDRYEVLSGNYSKNNGYLTTYGAGLIFFEELFSSATESRNYDLTLAMTDGTQLQVYSHVDCCSVIENGLHIHLTRLGEVMRIMVRDEELSEESAIVDWSLEDNQSFSVRLQTNFQKGYPEVKMWKGIPSDSSNAPPNFHSTEEFANVLGRFWLVGSSVGVRIYQAESSAL